MPGPLSKVTALVCPIQIHETEHFSECETEVCVCVCVCVCHFLKTVP
jgi:hypothetical protein